MIELIREHEGEMPFVSPFSRDGSWKRAEEKRSFAAVRPAQTSATDCCRLCNRCS
ncbi:hypothetical protein WN51_02387 [Melipona quadrifasciata]|uniref:Uncharacterized protein n=1 Tax=Melipona quadrifasciata TaxID=166423 RepID=A0A0M8ZVJ0_9HYME|nr:hypothetical protein WN51_02387 [Melipona quadrifasciata]